MCFPLLLGIGSFTGQLKKKKKNRQHYFLVCTVWDQCNSCACRQHVWPQVWETHFSTNLRLVALPSPPRYSSLFTSSCTAQSTPPPTALPLNNTPHGFEHPSASTGHSQSRSPAFRRQQSQTNSHEGFLYPAQSSEEQVLDQICFQQAGGRLASPARAQGHGGWQVNPFLLMHQRS